jgi:sugar lactone lactonase YvrE
MQFGPDGRLYVAQAMGSQVTAIDTATGALEVIAANGGPITGPDDVAFDSRGNLYATEVMSARVTRRAPDGKVSVVADNLPSANGVTVFRDRLFIDEHRPGGRLFELYPNDDRAPRLIADNLADPNALAGGPDGKLYFPLVPKGEIWRVDIVSGALEQVTTGLLHPTAAKFTPAGELISPQAGNGEVVKIDTATGAKTVVAKVRPGIDNLAIDASGRLFLSHFVDGGVAEVAMDGSNRERVLVQPGWVGPWGIAATPSGTAYLVDGLSLASLSPAGQVARIGGPLDKSAPRFVRALASTATGQVLMTTARGDVLLYDAHTEKARPLAEKLGQLKGVCEGANGEVFVVRADRGAAADGKGSILRIDAKGQVMPLVQNLSAPSDVAVWRDYCLVSETGARRLIAIDKDGTVTVVRDGLQNPRGMTILGDTLYLLDRGSRSLWSLTLTADLQDPAIRANDTQIATRLPVGAHCPLDFAGGLCASHDGGLLIAADGEGSVLSLRPA